MELITFGASVTGPGNRERGVCKQDAFMVRSLPDGWLSVVCDGLGSRSQSDWGARQACRAVRKSIIEAVPLSNLETLCRTTHTNWLRFIAPVTPDEAATTCLLAYVDKSGRATCAQLGDGLVLCRSGGEFLRVSPERGGFSDQTQALSAEFQLADWTVYECPIFAPGDGIVLMTDGVSDDIEPGSIEGFFDTLREETKLRKSRQARQWLTQQLHDWPTSQHSDDKTIAGIFRI